LECVAFRAALFSMTSDALREVRVLRPKRAAPADAVRPTRAEVNLAALRANLRTVRGSAEGAAIWAVLKADGYGHGAPAVARTLERAGVNGFCVALFEEGVELRDAGIRVPILVMGGYYGGVHHEMVRRGLVPVVYDLAQVEGFARLVRSGAVDGPVRLHLKVDTGMARLGVTMRQLPQFVAAMAQFDEVRVEGLMSHFASADAFGSDDTERQLAHFDDARLVLRGAGMDPVLCHVANSAGVFRKMGNMDAVRPGIALFGVSPFSSDNAGPELQQAMRVRTEVISLRDVPPLARIGYGGSYVTRRASRIATVAMGYADGLPRLLSNRGDMLVHGRRAPIIGAVSMDMTTIDVTGIEGVSVRDEVVVMGAQEGSQGRAHISAAEIATHAGTVGYEVLTSISRRVPRFYREP
jgi:alanine racemase